ncbi:hypothetical protein ACFIOY_18835 [Bradyrhizobium sp. TZ2]
MQEVDIAALRADCQLAAKFWEPTHSALALMTYREKGDKAAKRLRVPMLRQHQGDLYLQGLRKPSIRDHEPPSVRGKASLPVDPDRRGEDGVHRGLAKKVWLRAPGGDRNLRRRGAEGVAGLPSCTARSARGQDVQLTQSEGLRRIVLRSHLPFEIDASEELGVAKFDFP